MPRRPSTLKVGPFSYRIAYDPRLTEDGGETDIESHVITLAAPARGRSPDSTKCLALHEALHALFDACGLGEKFQRGPAVTEESAIVDLTVPLLACYATTPVSSPG